MLLTHSRQGNGSPLVLIHGLGSASTIWKSIVSQLADNFEVITVDLPGHGRTSYDPGQPMDPASLARVVLQTLESIGIRKFHVAGNSLGGWIALEIASHSPYSVLSLTGIAPAGLWLTPYTRINPASAQSRRFAQSTRHIQKYLLRMNWAKRIGFASTSPRWRELPYEYALDAALAIGNSDGYFPAWNAMLYRRFDSGISTSISLTIVFGDSDLTLPAKTCQERTLLPPHAKWITLSQCGHAPQWDYPDDVVRIISDTAGSAR